MQLRRAAVVVAALSVLAWPRPSVSQAKLLPIVQRASEYATAFIARFSNVVAEERYVQQTDRPRQRLELLADYLFVKLPGQAEWIEFRDVSEVNHKAVAGREQRMVELFVNPPANLRQRIQEVEAEGSRYNLEDIGTLDKPLIALAFLQPGYVDRFAFTIGRYERDLGPDVRVVQFREIARPTLLRGGLNDLPARGLYWVEEGSGRVVKTSLDFRQDFVTTTFRFDADLRIDVPEQMTQQWRVERGTATFTATSTYGRFRRFNVQTEEKLR